ncbi:MAG: hypothetical protein HZB16_14835 [Armatimonadetes bacterium]|nr:hypothetical protein [Armatimonadota bacterium]
MGAWLRFALLLGLGWGALAYGWSAGAPNRRRVAVRLGLTLVFGAMVSQTVYLFVGSWHRLAGPVMLALGGHAMLLCCGALLLIGVAWSEPKRHISRDTLSLATAFVLVVHGVVAIPAVIWLYLPRPACNWPDAEGLVSQATPVTCMAAAGAMLLARDGVLASEGQVAHWASTCPVGGTDSEGLRQALCHSGARAGLRGVMGTLDLARAERLGRPFVATVNDPNKGLHALFVTHIDGEGVTFVDPAGGFVNRWSRADFARRWFDVCVWLEAC